MEHSSLESFLWIEITLATFSFSGHIPVANDVLKMIEKWSDISSVSSLRILVGMLFGPADSPATLFKKAISPGYFSWKFTKFFEQLFSETTHSFVFLHNLLC